MENQVKRKSIAQVIAAIDPEKVNLQLMKPTLMEGACSNPDKIRFIMSIDREDWNKAVESE